MGESVVKYYVLCNRLKDVIRTGWKDWNVTKDRVESVAEHIFGVQMLAIADEELSKKYDEYRAKATAKVLEKDAAIQKEFA